jgi:hypothetical protein
MSYSWRSYKNTRPNYKFIKGQIQIGIFKKNILQVLMFQCPYGFQDNQKINKSFFFGMSFEIFVSFQILVESLCFFQFHTQVNM